jgi:sn-glycerol 3-phosphate transport system substrate-binding protein
MPRRSRWRRAAGMIVAAGAACLLTAGCASRSAPAGSTVAAPGAEVLAGAPGVVNVSFWHSMDGKNGDALSQLVRQFNAAHAGKVKVTAVYQGKYDDAITKYKTGVQSGQTPSLMQIYDIGTRFMIDSKQVIPVQSFIDKDKLDVSGLQPNIAGYYSIDNKLYSMPFNTSMPILYYNKDAFARAGLDPDRPPATLDEIRTDAQKLTRAGQAGFGAAVYGWYIEQWTAVANQEYCNNGNGRDAVATALNVADDTQVSLLDWWARMVKDGLAVNTGRVTTDAQNAFTSGKVAITLESTGTLRSFTEATRGKFALGTGFFPKVRASDPGGPIIGGASLWIDGVGHSPAETRAAWELVKFLASPDSQTFWHTHTGYFPISKGALSEPADVAWRRQYPQFDTAVRQLARTRLTKATQGCLLGVMPQARAAVETAIEAVLDGAKPPVQALQDAASSLSAPIASYNRSVR